MQTPPNEGQKRPNFRNTAANAIIGILFGVVIGQFSGSIVGFLVGWIVQTLHPDFFSAFSLTFLICLSGAPAGAVTGLATALSSEPITGPNSALIIGTIQAIILMSFLRIWASQIFILLFIQLLFCTFVSNFIVAFSIYKLVKQRDP